MTQAGRVGPATLLSAGASPVSEESRAFLQQRLALFAKIAFLLSSGFYLVAAAVAISRPRAPLWIVSRPSGYHLAGNLVLLATWIAGSRGVYANRLLRGLEAGCVFFYCLCSAAQIVLAPAATADGKYSMLLALTSVLIGRSVLVPSTPVWTLGLSTVSALPLVAASWLFDHDPSRGTSAFEAGVYTLWVLLWCVDAVALSVVTSHVIYGLRERVKEAMRLGQYTLAEKLGSGGMGEVYKASHALLKRPAAIKLLPPEKVGEPMLRRFEREVQLTSQLTHPNTIQIFDYGHTASGIFYYAMEYLDGIDLDRLVRRHGPQPAARVVHILRQVLGALQEAHQAGLIHRDIKPANIILCRRGGLDDVAKVVDFGLVKDLQAQGSVELTAANTIAGTPLYLSPEAIRSADSVGPESDLYAVGAVGYFLVAGRPPFEGSLIEVCSHHLHTPAPPPSQRLGRSVPRQLESVLLRCLEKDPARRPRSAAELSGALLACTDVGEWTQARATAWWRDHEQEIREPAAVEDDPATRTTALRVKQVGMP
jgi:eukaryotic-like serine/threonine-protein kinase